MLSFSSRKRNRRKQETEVENEQASKSKQARLVCCSEEEVEVPAFPFSHVRRIENCLFDFLRLGQMQNNKEKNQDINLSPCLMRSGVLLFPPR